MTRFTEDAILAQLLASVVNDVTIARTAVEQTGNVSVVDVLNRALIRLVAIEERVTGFTSYREQATR